MPVGAEVSKPGGGVAEQVPGDDQDRVADRDQGALLAPAAGDPVVARSQEVLVRAAPMPASPRVPPIQGLPLPVDPGLLLPADCRARGANLAHDTRWPAVGKRVISTPISAMTLLGAGSADTGILIQLGHLVRERGDRLIDPPGQRLDLGSQGIDAVKHHPQQVAVVVAELPRQRLLQDADLAAHRPAGQPGQHMGVSLPGDERFEHVPAGGAEAAADHRSTA